MGHPIQDGPRIQMGSPAYPRAVSTPQTAGAFHRTQRAAPTRYVPARNVVSRSGRVQPRWSITPFRRYALRKAQVSTQERVARGIDTAMCARTRRFLGRL